MANATEKQPIQVVILDPNLMWRVERTWQRKWKRLAITGALKNVGFAKNDRIYGVANLCQGVKSMRLGQKARLLFFNQRMSPQACVGLISKINVRSPERLHLTELAPDMANAFLSRFLNALNSENADVLIMDAWWEGDEFVIKAPTFHSMRIPLNVLPAELRGAQSEDREHFQIDEYGDFVYWPGLDIHMGWAQFQQAVDPEAKLRAEQKSEAFNRLYGDAIRRLRKECGLAQNRIDGLDARTVRRIEKGETRATSQAIAKLAHAHRLDLAQYMNKIARRMKPKTAGTNRALSTG
jgi:hypothetical protein